MAKTCMQRRMLTVGRRLAEFSRHLNIFPRTSVDDSWYDTTPFTLGREKSLRGSRGPGTGVQFLRLALGGLAIFTIMFLLVACSQKGDVEDESAQFHSLDKEDATENCDGKRVFMYDLPREFNLGVVERCFGEMAHWLNFCPHALNSGLGQLLDFNALPSNSSLFSQVFARRVARSSLREHLKSKVWHRRDVSAMMEDLDATHSCIIQKGGSWFGTDAYMLEEIFHKRMKHYSCLTMDPDLASAFFLPYYAGLEALEYLYGARRARAKDQGKGIIEFLEKHPSMSRYWKRYGGHDHFLVAGRTGWDFGRPAEEETGWGTGLFQHQELENVTFLVLEGRGWRPEFEQAVPYPTSFHPPLIKKKKLTGAADQASLGEKELQEWMSKVKNSRRESLFAFVGALRPNMADNIRGTLYSQCLLSNMSHKRSSNSSSSQERTSRAFNPVCAAVDCSSVMCSHNPQPVMDTFLRTEFCLQPPGDTATRRSTFDSIIAGCIPVFFHPDSAYTQYTWHLPLDPASYSVYISQEEIRQGKIVEEVLRTYSDEQIGKLRESLVSLLPQVIYMDVADDIPAKRCDGSLPTARQVDEDASSWEEQEDAFDVAVRGMLSKTVAFKSRVLS